MTSAHRSPAYSLDQLPGLSPDDCARLEDRGILTTADLYQQTTTANDREVLAGQLQTHIQHINKWAALVNLARIPGVGCHYCGLLLHAGIASPAQLAQTPIERLHRQLLKLQISLLKRPDRSLSLHDVQQWIAQAKALDRPAPQPPVRS